MSGIAWWAHIGGFVFGIVFLKLFDLMPSAGISKSLQQFTEKKHTHHLQVIRPSSKSDDINLYGVVKVTSREAISGTQKLVNIPWGFYNRTFRVTVPAGVTQGKSLRLKEMGKQSPDGTRGDLLLKVVIVGG
jgi:DnaJ-class molecular chaperone